MSWFAIVIIIIIICIAAFDFKSQKIATKFLKNPDQST